MLGAAHIPCNTLVIDSEMMAIAAMQEILGKFQELGQRRRILDYLLNKMVDRPGSAEN